MSLRRQSLLTVSMIVLGVAFALGGYGMAQSQMAATRGPYMIAQGDRLMVWRVDQSTGKISYCMRDSVSTDPRYIATRAPYCSAWSE